MRSVGTFEAFRALGTIVTCKISRALWALAPFEALRARPTIASREAVRTLRAISTLETLRAIAAVVTCRSGVVLGDILASHARVPAGAYRSRAEIQACRTRVGIVVALPLVAWALGPVRAVEAGIFVGAFTARKTVAALGVAAFAAGALLAASLSREARATLAAFPRHPGTIAALSSGTSGEGTIATRRARIVARAARTVRLLAASRAVTAAFLGLAGQGGLAHAGLRDSVGPAAAALAGLIAVARRALRSRFQTKFLSFRRIGHDEIPG